MKLGCRCKAIRDGKVSFQPGEGLSRCLLRDYELSCGPSFVALIVTVTPVTPCHEQISQYWRGKHRIKSKMEIDPATQGDAGIYECHANNKSVIDLISKLIILLSYNKMDSMGGGIFTKKETL